MNFEQVLGVDRATAFSDVELGILKEKHNVKVIMFYLGGPYYSIHGWNKADVDRTMELGFDVIPVYVGQNSVNGSTPPVLTPQQAIKDADQCIQLLDEFGFSDPKDIPVVLDVERSTYEYSPKDSAEYGDQWTKTMAMHGAIPGIYSSLGYFDEMIKTGRAPEWIVFADWVAKGFDDRLSLGDLPGIPNTQWIEHQRGWQYAGNVSVAGLQSPIDIDLFDLTKVIKGKAPIVAPTKVPDTVVSGTPIDVKGAEQDIANAIALLESAATKLKG